MKPPAFLTGAVIVAAIATMGGDVRGQGTSRPAPPRGFIPPGSGSSLVGAQTCRGCHASTHSTWTNGRHSRMLREARPASVIPAFTRSVTLRDQEYRLQRDGEAYFIVESYLQSKPTRRRVDYTLGSRRVQHYLSRLDDGRIVVLPPSYDVEKKEWFHNLDIVDLEEADAVKVQVWNSNCFGCHVSGEEKGFDPETRSYATTWTDFGTSCERCHGPGQAHAAKYTAEKRGESARVETGGARSPASTDDRDTAIVHPRRLDAETSTALCAQCHSLRDITQPGFEGGDNYYDHFTPLLEYAQKRNHDPAYWANGRPRRFSNEALAFWQSQCYIKGGAVCITCHSDAHEPDIDKNPRLARRQNDLCTGCHREVADLGTKHTRHAVTEADANPVSCVSCHMPSTSISLRHRMPDHTISVPTPENTRRFGIPNACNECHKDKSPEWSEERLASWFQGGLRERTVLDAVAFTLGARRDPAAVEPLVEIAGDASRPPLFRANALGYLRGFNAKAATAALLRASADPHPAVRLVALLSLSEQGLDPSVRGVLERGLHDARRTVRMASALGLLNAGAGRPLPADLTPAMNSALGEHARRARFLSEDPAAQLDLGKMFFLSGQWKSAETSLRDALKLDPRIPGGNYFLGLATLGQGRIDEAKSLLRSVERKDPHRKDADAVLTKLKGSGT